MNKKGGLLLVLATAIISGFSIFINKFSISQMDSSIFTFLKAIIVALFLFSIVLIFNQFQDLKKLTKKQWFQLVTIGLIGGAIPFLLFFKGLSLTSAASGAFIHKTLFIYASIFAIIFLKEKISKKIFLAALFLLVGNLLLLKLTAFTFGTGELLILSATIFWALENVLSKDALKDLSGNIVAFGRMFFGSLFILIFLAFTNKLQILTTLTSTNLVWTLMTSGLLLLFVITYYNGLKHIKVSVATSILLLGSPITTLLAFTFTSATVALQQFLGIALILIGIALTIFFIETPIASQSHTHNE